jgi:hypothetical protein
MKGNIMYTLTLKQLKTVINLAQMDGFKLSKEGFNYEYPYECNKDELNWAVPYKREVERYIKKAK